MGNRIAVSIKVQAPMELVWKCWNQPEHITQWNYLPDEWVTASAVSDFKSDGSFIFRLAPVNGEPEYDFTGKYLMIIEHRLVAYQLTNLRYVTVSFEGHDNYVLIHETFDAEENRTVAQQRPGWQTLLNNFKKYVESINTVQ